jgi:hypothetical protein
MTEDEWRHTVVSTLNRIDTGLNGVAGDDNNRGLAGRVEDLCRRIDYEESQRKRDLLPRLERHAHRIDEVEHKHSLHLARQVAWRQGLTFALGAAAGLLAVGATRIL